MSAHAARFVSWAELSPLHVCLGKGGFGAVNTYTWASPRAAHGREEVAVKEMLNRDALNDDDVTSLLREADIQASLGEHEAVAKVYGVAVDVEKHRYGIVMRLYRGGTVASEIKTAPPSLSLERLHRVARGLAFLHEHNIVHGDVKTVNLLLATAGSSDCAISDFGLAAVKGAVTLSQQTLGKHKGWGTPAFMAPELFETNARGKALHSASRETDVYAWAVMGWCMLTGHADPYPERDLTGMPIFLHGAFEDELLLPPRLLRPDSIDLRIPREELAAIPLPSPVLASVTALLHECWAHDPLARPTMAAVKARLAAITAALFRPTSLASSTTGSAVTMAADAMARAVAVAGVGAAVVKVAGGAAALPSPAAHKASAHAHSALAAVQAAGKLAHAIGAPAALPPAHGVAALSPAQGVAMSPPAHGAAHALLHRPSPLDHASAAVALPVPAAAHGKPRTLLSPSSLAAAKAARAAVEADRPGSAIAERFAARKRAIAAGFPRDDSSPAAVAEATQHLIAASRAGNVSRIRELLTHGAHIEVKDAAGCTPLHLAAGGGHANAVTALLEWGEQWGHHHEGADVTADDKSGATALHAAASGDHAGVIAALIAAGAGVDVRTHLGRTALHVAAMSGAHAAVLQLLECGSSPSAKDMAGATPLHLASTSRVVSALLEQGHAELEARDVRGRTPLQVADADGRRDAAQALQRGGRGVRGA